MSVIARRILSVALSAVVALALTALSIGVATGRGFAQGQSAGHTTGTKSGGGTGKKGGSNAPPGNNGTIKIDQFVVDSGHDNDPHVSCGLSVTFFGFDGGLQTASIDLTPWAPTKGGNPFDTTTSWNIGTRTGGGQLDQTVQISQSDLDANGTFTGITPQPHQGFHVKADVEVSGSQGSDDKYKVFWLEPCSTTPTSTTTTTTTTSTTTPTSTTSPQGSTTTTSTTSTTAPGGTTTTTSTTTGTTTSSTSIPSGGGTTPGQSVPSSKPGSTKGSGSSPAKQRGSLAFTGSNPMLAVEAALVLLGGGALLVLWRRRPRRFAD